MTLNLSEPRDFKCCLVCALLQHDKHTKSTCFDVFWITVGGKFKPNRKQIKINSLHSALITLTCQSKKN